MRWFKWFTCILNSAYKNTKYFKSNLHWSFLKNKVRCNIVCYDQFQLLLTNSDEQKHNNVLFQQKLIKIVFSEKWFKFHFLNASSLSVWFHKLIKYFFFSKCQMKLNVPSFLWSKQNSKGVLLSHVYFIILQIKYFKM